MSLTGCDESLREREEGPNCNRKVYHKQHLFHPSAVITMLLRICAQPHQFKFWHYDLATFYAELGDKENAFGKLNQSVEDHEQFIGFMKLDPFLIPLRDDPRFNEILNKAGLPPQ